MQSCLKSESGCVYPSAQSLFDVLPMATLMRYLILQTLRYSADPRHKVYLKMSGLLVLAELTAGDEASET